MGLFNFGRKETFLAVITSEGAGRLRINGLRVKDEKSKKSAAAHQQTVCWVEFAHDGMPVDQGKGRASAEPGQAERLMRDLPGHPTCRSILEHLRQGQDSVGKWLQLREPASG